MASLPIGWRENVGLKNYTNALTDPTLRSGFFKIFVWNISFAVISVLSTFLLGFSWPCSSTTPGSS